MRKFSQIDWWIVVPYLLLLGIGIVMVYSASFYNIMMVGGTTDFYFIKQLIYAVMGLTICTLTFMMKAKFFWSQRVISVLIFGTIFALLLVLIIGIIKPSTKVNGAAAWINLGFMNFQPLELAKVSLVLYLAIVLTNKEERLMDSSWSGIYQEMKTPFIIVIAIIGLVFIEPDTGGALILFIITAIILATSTIPGRITGSLTVLIAAVLGSALTFLLTVKPFGFGKTYQYQRFLAMQHPFKLERTSGAQLSNSYYAISNGGLFGVGLGNSIQKRGYLPEPQTDFILSIISEELGLIGVVLVLALLLIIIIRIIKIGITSSENYVSLICYGIATMFLTQIVLNVGGLLGLVPLTGVTLPFISYGGSSMMILSFALGIVLNLDATEKFSRK
ncbi:FtsW/RodA/SpoVE family cell cycle protein [Companilactobacillus metriopterae]|uniref:FtsW/RodA/SpoVE family cell cycle protein n=1 Tax=Companilactobacillus metriopterae TaxID=1909267 RepID=UPI00100A3D7E|nr:FtsW/RodA/SpoVE family cell cycle protein [Companilactobacillus metriopterae]